MGTPCWRHADGALPRRAESDATAIDERDPDGNGPLHELCPDPAEAEPIIAMLLAKGADPERRNDAGQTPAEHLEAMGSDDVGDLLEVMQSAR